MSLARFSFPTNILFGAGARRFAGSHLLAKGLKRPLLVTDRGLADLPLLQAFLRHLEGLQVQVFSSIASNPGAFQVMDGVDAYKAHGADCVIGFGGGAAMDVAKIVGVVATHGGDVLDFVWDQPNARPIDKEIPWFIALPTTAGTGSEVGRSAVITEDASQIKRIIFSPRLMARKVFADPELTLGLPQHVTAATGVDALTHNIESYLSPSYHPMCEGIALEGTRIAARALPLVMREPANLDARTEMMMASMMGAVAFQKDLGAVHACAHALSAVNNLHHGLANALMLEPVLEWNREAVPGKFDELAHVCGLKGGGAAFVPWLHELKQDIGITGTLSSRGVRPEHIPKLVEVALADISHKTNPRVCEADDFRRFFEAAL